MTTPATALYGLVGCPVEHSLSPVMMTAAFDARAIDATYLAFDVRPDALAAAIAGLRAIGARGFNVTSPHKQTVLPLVDELATSARAVGAVNTVVSERGRLVGHNTDASGFVEALREAGTDARGARAVLLGAGGAARAVAAGLARAGASSIMVAGRAQTRAEAMVAEIARVHPATTWRTASLPGPIPCGPDTDLLVNCTPAGMQGGPEGAALVAGLTLGTLPATAIVVDLVYGPGQTPLVEAARARGLHAIDGLTMLLHQGAAAFHLWTARVPPLDAMRRAIDLERVLVDGAA